MKKLAEFDNKSAMIVRHTVEDGRHFVRLFTPGDNVEFRIAHWPVVDDDVEDSLKAMWSGWYEAEDWSKRFGAKFIAISSSDEEAFKAFSTELGEYLQE